MSDNNDKQSEPTPQQYFTQLHQTLQQKNQIIQHLQSRIKNQQKQIDMLIVDAQQKHMHEITKYYGKYYQKYMKYGKYLLIKIQEIVANDLHGIYLPKYAKIVHFGELEVLNNNHYGENNGRNKQRQNIDLIDSATLNNPANQTQPQPQPQRNIPNNNSLNNNNENQLKQLKQLPINKQQSTVQSYIKGLTSQIAQLKQKVKIFANQKSASKLNNNQNNININSNSNIKENTSDNKNRGNDNQNVNGNSNVRDNRQLNNNNNQTNGSIIKQTQSKIYTNSPQISKFNQNHYNNSNNNLKQQNMSVDSKIYDPYLHNSNPKDKYADPDYLDLRSPLKKKNKTKVIRFRK